MSGIKSTRLLAIFISFVFVLASSTYAKPTDLYAPVERATPKKILHISGQLSSSLSVKILLSYVAANDSCKVAINRVEGAYAKRTKRDNIRIQLNGNKYDAIVPLDKYEEGYCRWTPFSIDFRITDTKGRKGPDNLVWIQTVGNTDSNYAQDGTDHPNEFAFRCRTSPSLFCMPQEAQDITTEAKELRINIVEGAIK